MFGIEALEVVIGLIFIYLLFSLFVSIVNEIISNLFNARGNQLYKSLESLIGEKGVKTIYEDPRVNVLIKSGSWVSSVKTNFSNYSKDRLPDFLPTDIVADILEKTENDNIGGKLKSLAETAKQSKQELTQLYELAIVEIQSTYRKNVRILTLVVGLVITIIFNVDTIHIVKNLSDNPEARSVIIEQTNNFISSYENIEGNFSLSDSSSRYIVANHRSIEREIQTIRNQYIEEYESSIRYCFLNGRFKYIETITDSVKKDSLTQIMEETVKDSLFVLSETLIIQNHPHLMDIDSAYNRLSDLYNSELENVNATLGLGWKFDKPFWGLKWYSPFGWFITAIALSMGAPFWFDTLKNVINIKNEIKKKEK